MNLLKLLSGKSPYAKHIRAMDNWLNKYSSDKGIYISNRQHREFPEVTGYWIETLLKWGYCDKAKSWFNWLISIQNADGGWPDYNLGNTSVLFDSGQIIRGIKCYAGFHKLDVSQSIKPFLSYFSKVKEVHLISKSALIKNIGWHLIHLQIAWIVRKYWPEYISLDWLKNKLRKSFRVWDVGYQASHFDVYVLEAMYELGIFPNKFKKYLKYFDKKADQFGYAPCDRKNNAPCYPGTAQLGVLYYKMGRKKDAEKILFTMLNRLNIRRGNWPGSVEGGNYGVNEEQSWTLKYFLDLLDFYSKDLFNLGET